jgi:hypothetical protein
MPDTPGSMHERQPLRSYRFAGRLTSLQAADSDQGTRGLIGLRSATLVGIQSAAVRCEREGLAEMAKHQSPEEEEPGYLRILLALLSAAVQGLIRGFLDDFLGRWGGKGLF